MAAPTSIEEALIAAGWTLHDGSACPVDEGSYPQILYTSGEVDCERADSFSWEWDEAYPGDNIIAYREIA